MQLFDHIVRGIDRPALHAEPHYDYLNASARPPFPRVRELLQQWADQHPDLVDQHWLDRFRSDDDRHYMGAFFEVYVATLLTRQGFSMEREPPTTSGKRPEFLVRRNGARLFVLECAIAAGPEFGSTRHKRIARVYDAINQVDSPNFWLGVRVIRSTVNDPPGSRLRSFLKQRLDRLDPDGQHDGGHWVWAEGGWRIEFTAVAKGIEARGRPDTRPLGMMSGGAKWTIETVGPLLDALKPKAARYGSLGMPYVIAVAAVDPFVDNESFRWALFGYPDHLDRKRSLGGFWHKDRNTRVSAVLFVGHLRPWTAGSATVVLWHNPWACYPFNTALWEGTQVIRSSDSEGLSVIAGKSGSEMLGLSQDWPLLQDVDEKQRGIVR